MHNDKVSPMRVALSYWWRIIKAAVSATAKLFDVRANLLLVLCYVGLAIALSYLLGSSPLRFPVVGDLLGDLRSEMRIALVFLFTVALTVLIYVFYLPAKLDREQTDLIDYYRTRHKTPRLRLRAINAETWVGIEVFNMEEDLRVDISSLIVKDIPQLATLTTPIQLVTEQDRHTSFRLPPKVWKTYLVARTAAGTNSAFLEGFYHQLAIETGSYEILTQLDGLADYTDIQPLESVWRLTFDADSCSLCFEKRGDVAQEQPQGR